MAKGLTAEQIFPSVKAIISQVTDIVERNKLETMILGEVESFERRVARISAELDKDDNYIIPSKNRNRRKERVNIKK